MKENNKIEVETMLEELQYALFTKIKGSRASGIGRFIVKSEIAINKCYRGGNLTTNLKTGIIRLLRKGQKDPTLTGNYRPISLL